MKPLRTCEICLREFPNDALGPVRYDNRTIFTCSECEGDLLREGEEPGGVRE